MSPRSTQQTRTPVTLSDGWLEAVRIIQQYLRDKHSNVIDEALDELSGPVRAQAQRLTYGVIRNWMPLEAAIGCLVPKKPSVATRTILLVAGFELVEAGADEGTRAKVTHHAVEGAKYLASPREAGFVNAVLKRFPQSWARESLPTINLDEDEFTATAKLLARSHSHQRWQVEHWMELFGVDITRTLLKWNQQPAVPYIRLERGTEPLPGMKPTRWPSFYELGDTPWADVQPLLDQHRAYMQDPFSRHPVDLLDPQPGETVLDLCSAPGGKARLILDRLQGRGTLVCADLPSPRLRQLRANVLERQGELTVRIVDMRVGEVSPSKLEAMGLPVQFDAVLIDVPCSNTGVIRRRPEARFAVNSQASIGIYHEAQALLLAQALQFVRPGGRIVYSTCSIEPEENEGVVEMVLNGNTELDFPAFPDFKLTGARLSYPWVDGHDGGGAFKLVRIKEGSGTKDQG